LWRGTLAISAIAAFVLIAIFRWIALSVLDQDNLRRRVLVLGTGTRPHLRVAHASSLRPAWLPHSRLFRSRRRADRVSLHGGNILSLDESR
jgi:hypothetical protein